MNTARERIPGDAQASEPSAKRLAALDGKKIVVVDDAFDPPNRDVLGETAIEEFVRSLGESGELSGALATLSQDDVRNATDVGDDLIALLWTRRNDESDLSELCRNTLFADPVDKLANVTPFCDHLRSLNFEVVEVGTKESLPAEGVGLVLVDYVLGPEGNASIGELESRTLHNESVRTSQVLVKQYYASFPHGVDKPFIVLMSSRQKVDVLLEDFRHGADLLDGMFDFVTKKELCDERTLAFKLRTWNYGLPTRHHIQHFAEAMSAAVGEVVEPFRRALKRLSLQDYVYIQNLALQDDGHPLGDYILWLYCALLEDLLSGQAGVVQERVRLDALTFGAVLPAEESPSPQLAELYQKAVGATSEPLGAHPRSEAGEPMAKSEAQTFPQLGDVFVKSADADVLMVLNASCDLAFAPGGSRACDIEQSILLIPGQLLRLYEAPADMKLPRTELFAVDGKYYRVVWRVDHVRSVPRRALAAQMTAEHYVRKYRLRLPYALLVQQAFASKLTRVGMPVAPPICVAVDVAIYCAGEDGKGMRLSAPVVGGAFVIHRKAKNEFVQQIVLTAKCVQQIVDILDAAAEQQARIPPREIPTILGDDGQPDAGRQAQAEARQKAATVSRAAKRAAAIRAQKADHDLWFRLVTIPRDLPTAGGFSVLSDGFIALFRNCPCDELWGERPPIALSVSYGEPVIPTADAAEPGELRVDSE